MRRVGKEGPMCHLLADDPAGLTRDYGLYIYSGSGMVDGKSGDHLMLAPALSISEEEVEMLVERVVRLVEDYFDEYDRST